MSLFCCLAFRLFVVLLCLRSACDVLFLIPLFVFLFLGGGGGLPLVLVSTGLSPVADPPNLGRCSGVRGSVVVVVVGGGVCCCVCCVCIVCVCVCVSCVSCASVSVWGLCVCVGVCCGWLLVGVVVVGCGCVWLFVMLTRGNHLRAGVGCRYRSRPSPRDGGCCPRLSISI